MSNIFDALQRSENDRKEMASIIRPEATELLMLAERNAAAKWPTAHPAHEVDATDADQRNSANGAEAEAGEVKVTRSGAAEASTSGAFSALAGARRVQISTTEESRLVCFSDRESPATEAFRLLGVRLRDLRRERPLKKILVTSSMPHDGKSVTASNLALTLATKVQERVLLLEGDLREPSLARMFGLETLEGLSDCILNKRKLTESISQFEEARLWLLPGGAPATDPLGLLQSPRLPLVLDELAAIFDWIIIDAPPVLPVADTTVLTRLSDAILFVVRQGMTEKGLLQKSLDAIDRRKLVGTVVNCSSSPSKAAYLYAGRQRARESVIPATKVSEQNVDEHSTCAP